MCTYKHLVPCLRLVLAAVSPFLSDLLSGQPDLPGEVTVLLPQVKRGVLSILLDFLYTGTMQVRFSFVLTSVGDPDPDPLVRCNGTDPDPSLFS
jgi:hypothetical protein